MKYSRKFDRLYELLAQFLEIGAPRPTLGAGIRIGVVYPCIVIYRYTAADDTVRILRIIHGRRKITAKLLRDA